MAEIKLNRYSCIDCSYFSTPKEIIIDIKLITVCGTHAHHGSCLYPILSPPSLTLFSACAIITTESEVIIYVRNNINTNQNVKKAI